MSNNATFGRNNNSTVPDGTVVETEDQGSGVQRQVVKVGNSPSLAAGTAAIGKVTVNPGTAQLTVTAINFSSSGDNTIIAAGTGSQTIKVYRIYFTVAGATTITFKDGVVTDAAQTIMTGGSFVLDFDGEPWFTGAAATAFKINSSVAVQVSGRVYSVTS